jgi:hypothetical protein
LKNGKIGIEISRNFPAVADPDMCHEKDPGLRGEFKFKRDYVNKPRTVKFRKTFTSDDFSI